VLEGAQTVHVGEKIPEGLEITLKKREKYTNQMRKKGKILVKTFSFFLRTHYTFANILYWFPHSVFFSYDHNMQPPPSLFLHINL